MSSSQDRFRPVPPTRGPTVPTAATAPWPVVAVVIFGVGVFCSGLLALSVTLVITGVVLVGGTAVSAAVLTRRDRRNVPD